MMSIRFDKALVLHLLVIGLLFSLEYVLPEYHQGVFARILVLAIYALGYNLLFGYTGLLSLGHALYFAAGMYGTAMSMKMLEFSALPAAFAGVLVALLVALAIGALALRTTGVSFMIVTMMFAQAGYLTILYFNEFTRGDEGFVIQQQDRIIEFANLTIDLTNADTRFIVAAVLFSICLLIKLALVRSSHGRVLIALRENEERTRMLGYNPAKYKLAAFVVSGVFAGIAGSTYTLLDGYAGATFASIQYSILPLLWVLLGGAGVVLGPLLGTITMFYLIDYLGELTPAWLLYVGIALVLLVLLAPKGLLGTLRERKLGWLP